MTAKLTASADGTKDTIGTGAEDALQIDATAKTIKAISPYAIRQTPQSGDVLQTLFFTDNGGALPNILGNVTNVTKNITPKSANSTIKISCSFYGAPIPSGSFINVQLKQVVPAIANVGGTVSAGLTTAGVAQSVVAGIVEGLFANTSLAQKGFQLWGNNATGTGGFVNTLVFTLTEVQN